MNSCFVIDGTLCGLNEIINKARYNRFAGAHQKKKETERCMDAISSQSVPTFLEPICIDVTWIEKNNMRDPDNIRAGIKFILDALVETKRIPGDSRKWVKEIHDYFPDPEKNTPRVIVDIKEFSPF